MDHAIWLDGKVKAVFYYSTSEQYIVPWLFTVYSWILQLMIDMRLIEGVA